MIKTRGRTLAYKILLLLQQRGGCTLPGTIASSHYLNRNHRRGEKTSKREPHGHTLFKLYITYDIILVYVGVMAARGADHVEIKKVIRKQRTTIRYIISQPIIYYVLSFF